MYAVDLYIITVKPGFFIKNSNKKRVDNFYIPHYNIDYSLEHSIMHFIIKFKRKMLRMAKQSYNDCFAVFYV